MKNEKDDSDESTAELADLPFGRYRHLMEAAAEDRRTSERAGSVRAGNAVKKSRPSYRRGKLSITACVSCGKCGATCELTAAAHLRNRADVLRSLKQDGWRLTSRYGWVCGVHEREPAPNRPPVSEF